MDRDKIKEVVINCPSLHLAKGKGYLSKATVVSKDKDPTLFDVVFLSVGDNDFSDDPKDNPLLLVTEVEEEEKEKKEEKDKGSTKSKKKSKSKSSKKKSD